MLLFLESLEPKPVATVRQLNLQVALLESRLAVLRKTRSKYLPTQIVGDNQKLGQSGYMHM